MNESTSIQSDQAKSEKHDQQTALNKSPLSKQHHASSKFSIDQILGKKCHPQQQQQRASAIDYEDLEDDETNSDAVEPATANVSFHNQQHRSSLDSDEEITVDTSEIDNDQLQVSEKIKSTDLTGHQNLQHSPNTTKSFDSSSSSLSSTSSTHNYNPTKDWTLHKQISSITGKKVNIL